MFLVFRASKIDIFNFEKRFIVLLFRPNQKIVVTLQTAELSGECDQDIVVVSSIILFMRKSMF